MSSNRAKTEAKTEKQKLKKPLQSLRCCAIVNETRNVTATAKRVGKPTLSF
jgi:hypothetical protein